MFGFGGSVKVYYCPTPVNLRKSFDGLAGAVEQHIRQSPESGHVFVFFSRNKKLVKILQWEGDGFSIWMKRLECGGFHLPRSADGRIKLSHRELSAILSEALLQKICEKIAGRPYRTARQRTRLAETADFRGKIRTFFAGFG